MSEPTARIGGRVLVVDPDERILLIHERIGDGSTHWLTPGGGVEGGEDPRIAAMREAIEEVGISLDLPAGTEPVLTTRRLWSWGSRVYDQIDHFYLARVGRGVGPRPRRLTELERRTLLGHAWWTVAELRATAEVLLPPDLGDVLERVLRPAGPAR